MSSDHKNSGVHPRNWEQSLEVLPKTSGVKRILVLNYEFPPLGGGGSPVSFEIAERLSKGVGYGVQGVGGTDTQAEFSARGSAENSATNSELHSGSLSSSVLPLASGYIVDVVTMGYKGLPRTEKVNDNFTIYRVPCLRSKKEICHPWEYPHISSPATVTPSYLATFFVETSHFSLAVHS